LSPQQDLKLLHKKIDQACLRAGVQPDTRAFHPHITLARVSGDRGAGDAFIERSGSLSSRPFRVETIGLYESRLGSAGASYTIVERYPLA
jgi:2'-5' RNA ligase